MNLKYQDLYLSSRLLRNYLEPLSSTNGGLLFEMCWNVFLSRLLPYFYLLFIFISMILASPANLGFVWVSSLIKFSWLSTWRAASGLLFVYKKDSEWFITILVSDFFLAFLPRFISRRHEFWGFFSEKSICMLWGLGPVGSLYLMSLWEWDLMVSSSRFLEASFCCKML